PITTNWSPSLRPRSLRTSSGMTTWPFEDSFVVANGAICSVASALTSKISIDLTGHQIRGVETAQLRPNPSDFLALLTSPKPFGRWGNLGATWAQNPLFLYPNTVFEECKAN